MAMTRDNKSVLIDEIEEKLRNNTAVYVTNASGMTVAEANNLRRAMRAATSNSARLFSSSSRWT